MGRLGCLASLVLYLFEFRIHDVLAPGAAAGLRTRGPARGCTRAALAGSAGAAALLGRVGALRDAGGGLSERLGLLVDDTLVIALERGAQVGDRAFHGGALAGGDPFPPAPPGLLPPREHPRGPFC